MISNRSRFCQSAGQGCAVAGSAVHDKGVGFRVAARSPRALILFVALLRVAGRHPLIFPYKHFHKNLLFSIDGVSKLWFDMMRNGTTLYSGSAPASNRAREHGMQQDFATFFEALTGFQPLPWQAALYERFVSGDCPDSASIPTGLGKTSVVAIWLIALAMQPDVMPRRLVYVVNRRTVVDQTTTEVEKLYASLAKKPELAYLAAQLSELAALPCDTPLAISTLRGQYTDNGEWKRDPSRPAVIIGTVDLIRSGLLFSHYRAGFKTRPLYAAFLG